MPKMMKGFSLRMRNTIAPSVKPVITETKLYKDDTRVAERMLKSNATISTVYR